MKIIKRKKIKIKTNNKITKMKKNNPMSHENKSERISLKKVRISFHNHTQKKILTFKREFKRLTEKSNFSCQKSPSQKKKSKK